MMKATLMLEDGKSFSGEALGAGGERIGEVILNTAVVGYQEMLTDPTNAGKILVLTYPLIGNYGIAPKFNESAQCWVNGLVIKENSRICSNWQAKSSFEEFAKEQRLLVMAEADTRSLAVHLRNKGEMPGVISTASLTPKELLGKIEHFRKSQSKNYLSKISVNKVRPAGKPKAKNKIAILDLGITNSTIKQLETLGLSLWIFPYNSKPEEILKIKPRGLIISNGPEDDIGLKGAINTVGALIGKLPMLGISTGHQVLAAAQGAKIKKLKLGHRGVNCPVYNPASYKSEITVQNHVYTVDADSLDHIKNIKITGYNLNDRSVEEIENKKLKLLGIQYYPVSPGFNEVNPVFKKFKKMIGS